MTSNLSRRGLLQASAALGLSAMALSTGAQATPKTYHWDEETDVLVAGGGCAGCMAAVEAAKAGRKTLLVQATGFLGGSSAISSGWIRSAGTVWHKQRGIQDSAEAYRDDIVAYGKGTRDAEKALVIARESKTFVDYLASIGVVFTDEEDRANGGEKLRIVKTKGAGAALMEKLAEAVSSTKGIEVRTSTRLADVILDAEGKAVIGAEIEKDGKRTLVKTPAVVIATGGFGRNQKIIEKYTNEWRKTGRIMDVKDNGDGLVIATNLGAGAANLDIAMVGPTLHVESNTFYSSAPLLNGGIIVNEKGRRFVNEYIIYTTTNREMLKQGKTWEIVSEDMHPTVSKMIAAKHATRCDSVEELARVIGCDPAGLKADIEEHNKTTRTPAAQRRDRFGRTVYGKELKAPFYILHITPVMIETVGGFTINAKSEITTLFGRPVAKGLYGAGACAFGEHFGVGYRSGEAYVYAGVTGLVAGREAAKIR